MKDKKELIEENILNYLRNEDKIKRKFQRGDKTSEQYKRLEKRIFQSEKEIKNMQFKFIEILAIFVAIIGFLFGFVKFSAEWQFDFSQTVILITLFGGILYGFILLIHRLFLVIN